MSVNRLVSFKDLSQTESSSRGSTSLPDQSSVSPDNTTFFKPPLCTPTKKVCGYCGCWNLDSFTATDVWPLFNRRCWKKLEIWGTLLRTWNWSGSPALQMRKRRGSLRSRRRGLQWASWRRRKDSWQVFRTVFSLDALPSERNLSQNCFRSLTELWKSPNCTVTW